MIGSCRVTPGLDALLQILRLLDFLLVPERRGLPPVHARQLCPVPHYIAQPGVRVQTDLNQHRGRIHARCTEVCPAEVRPTEARPAQIGPTEARPLQIGPPEVRPAQINPLVFIVYVLARPATLAQNPM